MLIVPKVLKIIRRLKPAKKSTLPPEIANKIAVAKSGCLAVNTKGMAIMGIAIKTDLVAY